MRTSQSNVNDLSDTILPNLSERHNAESENENDDDEVERGSRLGEHEDITARYGTGSDYEPEGPVETPANDMDEDIGAKDVDMDIELQEELVRLVRECASASDERGTSIADHTTTSPPEEEEETEEAAAEAERKGRTRKRIKSRAGASAGVVLVLNKKANRLFIWEVEILQEMR